MENNDKQWLWQKAIGTSWHGNEFLSTVEEIKKVFGEPDVVGNKDDKVQREVIYLRYDDINMKYIYLCPHCDTIWKTAEEK